MHFIKINQVMIIVFIEQQPLALIHQLILFVVIYFEYTIKTNQATKIIFF